MSTVQIGRLTVSWHRSPRSWLNIPRAFVGPEPRAQLHVHDWEYFVNPFDGPDDLRQCRACGANEARNIVGDPWFRNRDAERAS